ncbi:hypothetical protein KZO85_00200 [Chromohalobacter canadensis]|uniref:hypothetical protein n=1 Tax=Chromohalobacter canadensis TaxID=141389 RepID=UPI0021C1C461|nr:hypothetical protein [Chromohalobacter canadensis]MCT8466997.1 hypothetical protein [Chromohalobacter canadensis]
MKTKATAWLFVALLALVSLPAMAAEWYENGTLHDKSGLEWQDASYANKLATAGDFVATAYQRDRLAPRISSRISDVDDMRPLAEELVNQLNDVFAPHPDAATSKALSNQKVNETAAMLMVMMDWLDFN